MRNTPLLIVCLILAFSILSCEQRPEGILSKGEMEDVLYDYHLAQAMADWVPGHEGESNQPYIDAVFRKHGITQAEFDSSLVWYNAHASDLKDIYESLKDRYPKLVYANLTGFGEKGPDKDLPGFDYTAFFARSGWSGSLYQKGTVPSNLIPAIGDHQGAMALTIGVLAALYRAKLTGQGEKVSTNLLHTAIWVQAFGIQGAQYGTEFGGMTYPFDRRDNQLPYQPAVKTKDGRFLQVMGPNFGIYWGKILQAIGRTDLLDDPVMSDQRAMIKENRLGEAYDVIQEGFAQKTAAEWIPILNELDVPVALCATYDEVVKDEQAWANDVFYEMDYPRGKKALVTTPIDLENTPLPEYKKAPLLGADTESVLSDLGYSADEIKAMIDENVAGVWKEPTE